MHDAQAAMSAVVHARTRLASRQVTRRARTGLDDRLLLVVLLESGKLQLGQASGVEAASRLCSKYMQLNLAQAGTRARAPPPPMATRDYNTMAPSSRVPNMSQS